MEFIFYLLLQLGILLGNPTPNENAKSPVKQEQTQPMLMKSSTTGGSGSTNIDGGSGTWGDNG